MYDKTELNQILHSVRNMYREQYHEALKNVLLYGSYARNENTDDSDIDIAGIVEGDRKELQEKLKIIWDQSAQLGYRYNVIVSPVVIPEKEFEEYQDTLPYYRNIKREGIPVE